MNLEKDEGIKSQIKLSNVIIVAFDCGWL